MKRVTLAVLLALGSLVSAGDIGFIEEFALAKDRTVALRQLIPGTEDYYYYHALHYLNTEQYAQAEALFKPWHERFHQTARLTEIQTRHALLTYDRNPQKTLQYLRDHLGLQFNHQKAVSDGPPNLPTSLDQKLFSRDVLKTMSLNRWGNLDNFENRALEWMAAENLSNWQLRRNLLQRLERPDVPNLVSLITADLAHATTGGFGSLFIHKQLTLTQLDELVRARPDLLNQNFYVQNMLAKLQPGADDDWRHDPALTRAYLDRLLTFTRRLLPAHNALMAHVLYHRLVLDRSQGNYDQALFIEYLKLPRQQPYMAKSLLEAPESQRYPANLNADFRAQTQMTAIRFDEPLVRDYLKHFFATATTPSAFSAYIDGDYLKHLFAETKIELGLGDGEQWAAQLPPEMFRQLKERIDIDFDPTNKTVFAADEPVTLDLHVKNVSTLIVKVFEINTAGYYREHKKEIDTDVNLDGLVANEELTHPYTEPPLRRMPRRFSFPKLNKSGVYVIDFIGAGKSSRALVRKGRLRPLVGTSTAGQTIRVVDETNHLVKDAAVWLGGADYAADADGVITIPFSTNPGRQPIVIRRGDFASLDFLVHSAENFALTAGIHIDREALLTQRLASVIVRPGLTLNGKQVSVSLLEEVKLRLLATDNDGIATSTEVPNFKLFEDRESTYEFRVPTRLASLQVTLVAKVKSLSLNKSIDVSAAQTFTLNGIDKTEKIEDLHFAKFAGDYVIEVLGRSGEPRPDRPVQVQLKHRDFKEPVNVVLKSDARGRVLLGPLAEIVRVNATGPEGVEHSWNLPEDRHTYRQLVHAKAGETIALPYTGKSATPTRTELALFEMRGSLIRADRFNALGIHDGMIEIKGLAAGDYDLWLKRDGMRVRLRVVDGTIEGRYVLGKVRHLELPLLKPVQIASITAEGDNVTIRLRDVSPFTRVHVYGTRYRPAYSAYGDLSKVRDAELAGTFPAMAEAMYLTGRNIGDEYRYVLDRRYQKKYAGNMLERPNLLLNPWAMRSTETNEVLAQGGEAFGARGGASPGQAMPPPATVNSPAPAAAGEFANLDFLADATAAVLNLVPDKDGVVKLTRKELGPHAWLHVIALDPLNTTTRWASLAETPANSLDLRLRAGLDPKQHFTQQKQVSVLPAGQGFVLSDVSAGRFEVYDSLPRVYGLYATLSHDPKLAEFAFVMNWPTLKIEEKRTLYSKYACHELSHFLSHKDPEFFKSVVQPYLANKKDKTFMDHWLLGNDLRDYLAPWTYDRLNSVERILLAQRIAGEPAKTQRHLNDLIRLKPPASDRERVLFDTALRGFALDSSGAIGRVMLARELKAKDANSALGGLHPSNRSDPSLPIESPQPAERPAAMPGMGGGGGAGRFRAGATKGREEMEALKSDEKKLAEVDRLARAVEDKAVLFGNDRRKSGALALQLYRRVDATQEWAEHNYYHLLIQQQIAELVTPSQFWLDYAKHDGKTPFLSKHLADASRNFTEIMFALAVLDLPFTAAKHDTKFDGGKMTFTPAGPVIAFHEEIRPAGANDGKVQILLSQNFYRYGDRYREEGGERFDKFVTDEFVVHTVYGGQLVITNPTPSRQRLTVLVQTPVGSIPLANGRFTRGVPLDLEPYRTQTIDFLFYFPKAGTFTHYPAHVSKNGALVASVSPFTFHVVDKPSKLDTESWEYVSQNGTTEQVLAFLNRENVSALDLEKIAFRMRDRATYTPTIKLLTERHAYQPTLWSYGVYHNDVPTAREYLRHNDHLAAECGGPLESALLGIDPVARHTYEHWEYKPLVNSRAHSLGAHRKIVNEALLAQYHRTLHQLTYRKLLSDTDQLAVTYYLLLQDRIEEALATFAQVNPAQVSTRLQYDYCAAWLDLCGDEPLKARPIAQKYANHPVDRWRNAFAALASQLDEIEGKAGKVADAENRDQRQGQLAAKAPSFEMTLDGKTVNLTYQNVETLRINYYLMDVELLFSRNAFVQQSGGQFASIRPNATQELKLPADKTKAAFLLPDSLAKRNVLVEVSAGGITRSLPYYANAMNVQLTEAYGQLKATDAATGKALAKVYVKTYVRLADGTVKFHKDGYTDHRGRFDYSSVSGPEKQPATRFAVLVLSEDHGAQIREVAPPQQ